MNVPRSLSAMVYWAPWSTDVGRLTRDFETIRGLGFDCIRAHDPTQVMMPTQDFGPEWAEPWLEAAERADIGVILHGFNEPTPRLLEQIGLAGVRYDALPPNDPRLNDLFEAWLDPFIERYKSSPPLVGWAGVGEPPAERVSIHDEHDEAGFRQWLLRHHGDAAGIDAAWNIYPDGPIIRTIDDAVEIARRGAVGPADTINGVSRARLNYGAVRDLMRFKTDQTLDFADRVLNRVRRLDPSRPCLLGIHQLLGNNAEVLWDNPKRAKLPDVCVSSIHLSWHYELVEQEVDRPTIMQAKMTADHATGPLSVAYETTGGPVQFSGGHGNPMSPGLMRRLCLAYLAGGNRGMGFWTWNSRPGGWEAGEYAMTTLDGRVTPWAETAGEVATNLTKYADELAASDARPRVALLEDWDTQAIYCLEPEQAVGFRDPSKLVRGTAQDPRRSLVGWSRALLDANVPFRYVTADSDLSGFEAVVVTNARALSDETLAKLSAYARDGGHLVADAQFGFMDQWGKVRPTGVGGAVDAMFGGFVAQLHDVGHTPLHLHGAANEAVRGFVADLVATSAETTARFADGRPAVLHGSHDRGRVTLIGFEPGRLTHHPGRVAMQSWMVDRLRLSDPSFDSSVPATTVLHGEDAGADHVFVHNDGPERPLRLHLPRRSELRAEILAGTLGDLSVGGDTITGTLPANDALWLRLSGRRTVGDEKNSHAPKGR